MITWSLVNCWTRIYLGVHYPGDIAVGLLWGALVGYSVYRLYCRVALPRHTRKPRRYGHIREASVFCTPSIALEYSHLDEIRAFDTDLIEMETSSFYLMTALFELPGVALLVVSDNSAAGVPLVGRTEEQQQRYEYGRSVVLPDMILALTGK